MGKNMKSEESTMSNLRELLLQVMNEYGNAITERFAEHPLGTLVRSEIPEKIFKVADVDRDRYVVKGSVGQGNWAKVPWIAIMNKEVTTTTQEGFYLVYLFREDMSKVFLTLAQGVTKTDRDEMERINEDIRAKLDIDEPQIHKNNDYVLGESDKAKKYQESTALFIEYERNHMPSDGQLISD